MIKQNRILPLPIIYLSWNRIPFWKLFIRTKWASPLQLPYPSIMRGLDTLRAEHNCEAIFYLLCEYPRFAGADPAHIIFSLIGKTLSRFSVTRSFL